MIIFQELKLKSELFIEACKSHQAQIIFFSLLFKKQNSYVVPVKPSLTYAK